MGESPPKKVYFSEKNTIEIASSYEQCSNLRLMTGVSTKQYIGDNDNPLGKSLSKKQINVKVCQKILTALKW